MIRLYLFSGKIQIALVWNSRSETSQNSEKLNALANVSFENPPSKRKKSCLARFPFTFYFNVLNDSFCGKMVVPEAILI